MAKPVGNVILLQFWLLCLYQNITSFILLLPIWSGWCWVCASVAAATWGQAPPVGCQQSRGKTLCSWVLLLNIISTWCQHSWGKTLCNLVLNIISTWSSWCQQSWAKTLCNWVLNIISTWCQHSWGKPLCNLMLNIIFTWDASSLELKRCVTWC